VSPRKVSKVQQRLRVDPVACDGVGMCGHFAPELITVDSWGYPIIAEQAVRASQRRSAQSAVAGCPRKALFLDGG
jgi:ferredoxin